MDNSAPQSNTLGNVSLALGIASAALVFGIGMCALAVPRALQLTSVPLFVCGASSAFLRLLGAGLGVVGFGLRERPWSALFLESLASACSLRFWLPWAANKKRSLICFQIGNGSRAALNKIVRFDRKDGKRRSRRRPDNVKAH